LPAAQYETMAYYIQAPLIFSSDSVCIASLPFEIKKADYVVDLISNGDFFCFKTFIILTVCYYHIIKNLCDMS
jgi:hypothetical protein